MKLSLIALTLAASVAATAGSVSSTPTYYKDIAAGAAEPLPGVPPARAKSRP